MLVQPRFKSRESLCESGEQSWKRLVMLFIGGDGVLGQKYPLYCLNEFNGLEKMLVKIDMNGGGGADRVLHMLHALVVLDLHKSNLLFYGRIW